MSAGKFRRYHGAGWRQLLDVPTMLKNIRDVFKVIIGTWQSYWLLGKLKPDVIFIKGGFVGVPVGISAHWRRIPYVTHDSDAIPGLANRLIAKHASLHAVGMPKELYNYPQDKTVYVGVPISANNQLVGEKEQSGAKQLLSLTPDAPLLLVTGGGLGAERINNAVLEILSDLLREIPSLHVAITTGRGKDGSFITALAKLLTPAQLPQVIVKDYVTDLHVYIAAADVVVGRAGATNLAELAAQGKASIIIPNPQLTGGHQLKNAEVLAAKQAIVLIKESDMTESETFKQAIIQLLSNKQQRQTLGATFHTFATHNAARELAALLLQVK